ncbi:cardiolipin synthase [Brevibacillus daliensis]|uniref:cardiolipin synthase n=1 Tax=Brevibacillus daliensis TaxID=2892995 RepID=UPI001E5D588B|nr:cardiolipin synthase [Brevibacillus daliensis]
MKKGLEFIFSRMVLVGLLVLIQAIILMGAIWKLSEYFVYFYGLFAVISLLVVLYIVNKRDNPSYKLAWTIPILLFPVFGGLLYLLFGLQTTTKRFKKMLSDIFTKTQPLLKQDDAIIDELQRLNKDAANQSNYLINNAGYPVYKNTTVEYLTPGEMKFERLKEELQKAERYIFLEYFIIQEGIMWDSILEILVEKAEQGVDVRLLYDDMGCLNTLPYQYDKKLRKLGIQCKVFNPFVPALLKMHNNRDHRKIVVIDGHTAFTGGINLADEYINAINRFGHWKDASIMLKGEAVWSFTIMFLQMWGFNSKTEDDYEKFKPHVHHQTTFESDGFVQPYGDSPMDKEIVGELVYINMIIKAKEYVYINTPYLIVDNEMVTVLTLAAKSGVDVRIITPFQPDKWYVHTITRAYYPELIEAGVKIYEYTPGFIHSKTFVSDDEMAVVGTINLDYRSLYLHFECGVWMYKNKACLEVKEDFLQTLQVCKQITLEDTKNVHWVVRATRSVLRLFAPLM